MILPLRCPYLPFHLVRGKLGPSMVLRKNAHWTRKPLADSNIGFNSLMRLGFVSFVMEKSLAHSLLAKCAFMRLLPEWPQIPCPPCHNGALPSLKYCFWAAYAKFLEDCN